MSKINNKDIIVTNDDCRPPDYQEIKRLGFVFVGINGFCRDRTDQTKADLNHTLEWQKDVQCDLYINNFGSIAEYKIELKKLLTKINGNNYEK